MMNLLMLTLILGAGQYAFSPEGGAVLPYESTDFLYLHYSVASDIFYYPVASILVTSDSVPSQDTWWYTVEPWPFVVAGGFIPVAQMIVIVKPDDSKYTIVRYRWRSNYQWNDDTETLVAYWFTTECLKEIGKGNKEAKRVLDEVIRKGVESIPRLADSADMPISFYLEAGLQARIIGWGRWDSPAYKWNIKMMQEHPTPFFRQSRKFLLTIKNSIPQDTLP